MFKGLLEGIVGIYLSIVGIFHQAPPPAPVVETPVTETSIATATPQVITAPKNNEGPKTLSVTERLRQEVASLKKQVGAVTQQAQTQPTQTKPTNPPAPTVINVTVQQPPITTTSVSQTPEQVVPTLSPVNFSLNITSSIDSNFCLNKGHGQGGNNDEFSTALGELLLSGSDQISGKLYGNIETSNNNQKDAIFVLPIGAANAVNQDFVMNSNGSKIAGSVTVKIDTMNVPDTYKVTFTKFVADDGRTITGFPLVIPTRSIDWCP